jgi:hypothetical protein
LWEERYEVGTCSSYDRHVRLLLLPVLAAALGLASPAAAAQSSFFRTPSGNIYCAYFGSLRCDIRSGLVPRPAKPAGCDFDWGGTFELGRTGAARVGCVSDSVFTPSARVLRYGTRWSRGGIVCVSRTSGLRCTNASRRGFFLSRARSFRF